MLAAIPLIPYLQSSEDVIYLLYVMARVGGLFIISPLLSNATVNVQTRLFLSLFTTLLLAMALYPDYRGDSPKIVVPELLEGSQTSALMIGLTLFKELSIGYLIGFAFSILYEGLLLAGQLIGIMIGFSITDILDPVSNTSQSLIGQMFTILASLIILTLDLHHDFIRVTAESFLTVPIGHYHFPYEMIQDVSRGTGSLFVYGAKFSAIPLVILCLVTVGLGFMARVMPEMNIFMVGFPLKILIGYYTLVITISYFPLLLNEAFVEMHNFATLIIHHLGG